MVNTKEMKSLESYMLMSILRNLNIVVFGRRKEFENSLIYLPTFYGFGLEKSERYSELKEYEGPLILIIMPEKEKCLKLQSFIQQLFPSSDKDLSVGVLLNENLVSNVEFLLNFY